MKLWKYPLAISLLVSSSLALANIPGTPYVSVLGGLSIVDGGQSTQLVDFGPFQNRFIPNNKTSDTAAGGIELGYRFKLAAKRIHADRLGILLLDNGSNQVSGTEQVMVNTGLKLPELNYSYDVSTMALFVANALEIPLVKAWQLDFLTDLGMVKNKVNAWKTSPKDPSGTGDSGNPFRANTRYHLGGAVGVGLSYAFTRLSLSLDYLYSDLGSNTFKAQLGQTTENGLKVKTVMASDVLLRATFYL